MWLDAEMTSPYAFFQFWLNADDADVVRYLKVFTFLSRDEIDALASAVDASAPAAREAQRTLAYTVTSLVHGTATADQVVAASQALFGRGLARGPDARDPDRSGRPSCPRRPGRPATRSRTCSQRPAW